MKSLLQHTLCVSVIILVLCHSAVWAEVCTAHSECKGTACSARTVIICQHPIGKSAQINGGLCTCADVQCTLNNECFDNLAPSLQCHNSMRHCYDQRCLCDMFPGDTSGHEPIGK